MADSGNYLISFRVGLPAEVVRGSDPIKATISCWLVGCCAAG